MIELLHFQSSFSTIHNALSNRLFFRGTGIATMQTFQTGSIED